MRVVTRVIAVAFIASSNGVAESPSLSGEPAGIAEQQRADVAFLASEQLRGRGVGDETIKQAANYIASRMNAIGLQTDLFEGTPFQRVDVPLGARAGSAEENRVVFRCDREQVPKIQANLGDGMNPLGIGTTEGQFRGPIAFVGYGITAEKLDYDDYASLDVSGHAVMMLRKEPAGENGDAVFNGPRNTRHAYFATKISNAIAHRAAAVLLVNDAASVAEGVQAKQKRLQQEQDRKELLATQIAELPDDAVNSRESLRKQLVGVDGMIVAAEKALREAESGLISVEETGTGTEKDKIIPVLAVSRGLANQLLQASLGDSIEEIEQQINQTVRPRSEPLSNWQVDLVVKLEPTVAETANVVGVLPGRGPLAEESVVIGAHYDHVGMGGFGSLAPGTIAVHNGADDNASGVAVLLASATQLKSRLEESESHRRIIFIAFTGEERGLLGSKHYAKFPRFPLEKTAVMINLDMVGRLRDNELTLYGTGSSVGMNAMIDRLNLRHGFDIYRFNSGYGPSDHQSFYERGVPVLFFFTGLHNDYHRPTDDFDKIDFGGMVRITDMVSDAAREFATADTVPQYAKTGHGIEIRRQLTAYLGVSLASQSSRVLISAVTPGAPAERGGLREGDLIEKIGKRYVHKTSEVLDALRQRAPGDTINIQILRRGRRMSVPITLERRPAGD